VELGLEIMWFRFPEDFFWNLNAEQGYGTLFFNVVFICSGDSGPLGLNYGRILIGIEEGFEMLGATLL
jgi:hypothetical protein